MSMVFLQISASQETVAQKRKYKIRKIIEYPSIEHGYTPQESLIESIEGGEDKVQFYFSNFGINTLKKIDPVTSKSLHELALNAGNYHAACSLERIIWVFYYGDGPHTLRTLEDFLNEKK